MGPNYNGFGGDVVVSSSSSVPTRKPIRKIVLLALSILAVIAIAVVLVVFLIIKPNQGSVSEVYSKLWDFYYDSSYQDLIAEYDAGIDRMKRIEEGEFPLIFPFTEGWITQTKQGLESVRSSYNDIENLKIGSLSNNQKKEFNNILKETKTTMDTIESNVDTVSAFYDAFVVPLNALSEGKSLSCSKTEKMSSLIGDSNTSDAANKYFTVYCEVIKNYPDDGDWEALMNSVSSRVVEASKSLDSILESVDNTSEDSIKKLLSELTQ